MSLDHNWHVVINKHIDGKSFAERRFMYEGKTMASEVPRMIRLFAKERLGQLRTTHQQCSHSPVVPVPKNELTCCLGVKCRECPEWLALEQITGASPDEIDTAKAWTCAAHIVSKGGDIQNEGYILTTDDRMFWDNVYQSLARDDGPPGD